MSCCSALCLCFETNWCYNRSLDSVQTSRTPPSVHFSALSTTSLSFQSLPRTFPPPTQGFTFLAWISISHLPPSRLSSVPAKLALFTTSDLSQKSFFEISLCCPFNSYQISLTTSSVKSPAPFDHPPLIPGKWYHVAIVHPRPRYSLSSPVTLYLDGVPYPSIKLPYPSTPTRSSPVSSWFGRPPPGGVRAAAEFPEGFEWELGPTYLIEEELSKDKALLAYSMEERYLGNFQDRLGPFQTNESSTKVRVELGEEEKVVELVKGRLINEQRLLFALNARNGLGEGSWVWDSGLSEQAKEGLLDLCASGSSSVILNSAFPLPYSSFSSSITSPTESPPPTSLYATLHSNSSELPLLCLPTSLDTTLHSLAPLPLLLKFISLSRTSHQLVLSLSLLTESLAHNWRLSEDAEKSLSHEALGGLLRRHAEDGLVDSEVAEAAWRLVSGDAAGVIENQAALRWLVLDVGIWSRATEAVVRKHWDRFRGLVEKSERGGLKEREREFNVKCLVRMRECSKLIPMMFEP